MSKKTFVKSNIERMSADKARIEKQLRAGELLAEIGITIVSPIAIPATSEA